MSTSNREILKHRRATHKLEMAATEKLLQHLGTAEACTTDSLFGAKVAEFGATVMAYRTSLVTTLAKAEAEVPAPVPRKPKAPPAPPPPENNGKAAPKAASAQKA